MELNERDFDDNENVWCNDVDEPPFHRTMGEYYLTDRDCCVADCVVVVVHS